MPTHTRLAIQKTLIGVALGLLACGAAGCSRPALFAAEPAAEPVAASPAAPAATPDPAIPQLPAFSAEGPLAGAAVEIPEVWIVPSSQSKQSVAEHLKTTVDQLDWVNPGLGDYVVADTLVVLPPAYRLSSAESLAAIASTTGVSEDLIRAANPAVSASAALSEGDVIAMPAVTVLSSPTDLSSLAASLNLSGAELLSANPDLAGHDIIQAGTILVVPPTDNP